MEDLPTFESPTRTILNFNSESYAIIVFAILGVSDKYVYLRFEVIL